jgi:IS5 family transposase
MIDPQGQLDFRRSNLNLTKQYYGKYDRVARTLEENRDIVACMHEDLRKPLKYAGTKGKDGRPHVFTSDQVLRILICQAIEGASLREIVIRIDDSEFLRHFTRIGVGPMMDYSTLDKMKNSIRPETWKKVNRLLAEYAVEADRITGERMRLDTSAVETDIHYPTDSGLLWDVYRVLARLIGRAREIDPEAAGTRRLHRRAAKRLHLKISRAATKKGDAAPKLKPLYRALIEQVEGISAYAGEVSKALQVPRRRRDILDQAMADVLAEEMEQVRGLGAQAIDQARRRVILGERVPNEEKLYSIFEPHTELLIRGKAGKEVEFGHMIQIQQVRQKFITDYEVFPKKPVEHQLLEPALKSHRDLFGAYPKELAADKGYYESVEVLRELRKRIGTVSIGKKGSRTEEETEIEEDPAFRHMQRFRAGVEGTISFLKRVFRLARCFNRGWEHFVSTVGAMVFSHNLLVLARC